MSAVGGIPVAGGPAPAAAPRRDLPGPLATVRVLLLVLVGATALGAVGLSGSAIAADAMGAQVLGILLYASAPGVLCALLAWHLRTGGKLVRWGIVAAQVWLIVGGLGNLADGSPDGLTQLVLPVLILVLLSRAQSRAWFLLPPRERGEPPKFSLPYLITWRRDRGQSALEYLGLVLIVVALIAALTVGGLGGRITEGLQSAICSLTGSSCPVSGGSGSVEAGDTSGGTGADGGSSQGADRGRTAVRRVMPPVVRTRVPRSRAVRVPPAATRREVRAPPAATRQAAPAPPAGKRPAARPPAPRDHQAPPAPKAPPAPRDHPAPPHPAAPVAPTTTDAPVPAWTPSPRTTRSPRPPTTSPPRPKGTARAAARRPTSRRTAAAGASSAAPGTVRRRSSRAWWWTASGATSPGSSTCSSPRPGPVSRSTDGSSATSGRRTPRAPATSGATATTWAPSGTGARPPSTPWSRSGTTSSWATRSASAGTTGRRPGPSPM